MTVLVSDSNNPSYDGNLSTPDGFYEVEAHNLPGNYYGNIARASFARTYPVSFANAGNCQGFVFFPVFNQISNFSPVDFRCNLELIGGTCTITNATPAVVTKTGHGYVDDDMITFRTTSALPSPLKGGVIANTSYNNYNEIYWVEKIDDNTFYILDSASGTRINTTSAGGGTQTVHRVLTTKTVNADIVMGKMADDYNGGCHNFAYPFIFTTKPAVTTDSNKYQFTMCAEWTVNSPTLFGYPAFRCSANNSTLCYATWCDNKKSFTDLDTVIFKDKVTIDQTCEFGATLGTSYTTYGVWGVMLTGDDPDDDTRIEWENTPLASYTMTINGGLFHAPRTSIKIGSSINPIPYAKQAIITCKRTPNVGTAGYSGFGYKGLQYYMRGGGIYMYGEIPTFRKTTLNGNVAIGSTALIVNDSVDWKAGETIIIGGQNQREDKFYTIDSVVGTTINLTSAITASIRYDGGTVAIKEGYGIHMQQDNTTSYSSTYFHQPSNMIISGVLFDYINWYTVSKPKDNAIYTSTWSLDQNFWNHCFFEMFAPAKGASFTNSITNYMHLWSDGNSVNYGYDWTGGTPWEASGLYTIQNNNHIYYSQAGACASTFRVKIDNNTIEGYLNLIYIGGTNPIFTDNSIFGLGYSPGAPQFANYYNDGSGENSGNTLEANGTSGVDVGINTGLVLKDWIFGTVLPNPYDLLFGDASYYYNNVIVDSPSRELVVLRGAQGSAISGSRLSITNNGTIGYHVTHDAQGIFSSTGDGLVDTTVHTSGTGKYAIRFESLSDTSPLIWKQSVPTSDIKDKSMAVAIWCKINNADYYSATHALPKLEITYDNGTVASATAIESTDWQLLVVSFTPITAFGEITVKVSTMTDQTTTSAYVYFDDMSVLYPAGHQLNLGGLDDWAKGLPVTPSIATNLSAIDVWTIPVENLKGAETIGNFITKLLSVAKFLGLK